MERADLEAARRPGKLHAEMNRLERSRAAMSHAAEAKERLARVGDDAEMRPPNGRPEIPLLQETHRLLRAVAMKRAAKNPGTQPSIAAVIEEMVERARPDLLREAGALFERELAKKR